MNKKAVWILIVVWTMVLFPFSHVSSESTYQTYYISTTGSDSNPGTLSKPWRTIQKGANVAIGGDTIVIRGGTYNERVVLTSKPNASGPFITFTAYPGEEVIIDGTGIAIDLGGGLFHIWNTDYIRVIGLKIIHSNGAGIYVAYSDNISIENNRTYDTVKSGVGIWGSNKVVVDGTDIALACNSHPNYPASEENISIDNSSNVEVRNNFVHKAANIPDGYAGGEGINIKNGSSYVKVYKNIVRLDERSDGKPSNRLAYGIDAWNSTKSTHDIEFFANIAYNSSYGFIVSSEQGGVVENVKIYNNIAYNNIQAGFAIVWWSGTTDGWKRNIQFINNTSYKNGYGFRVRSSMNESVIFRNNILSLNTTNISIIPEAVAQTTIDHNLFYGSGATMGTNAILADPLFINPNGGDFHLQSNSPAIDAGSSADAPGIDFFGIFRPQNGKFDIGALEFFLPGNIENTNLFLPIITKK